MDTKYTPEGLRALEADARRFHQLLDHPRDAHHLFALLLAHTRTNVQGKAYMTAILDQLHLQDLATKGQLEVNRAWQAGRVDERSGTEIAADKMIIANMEIVDLQREMRARKKGLVYVAGEPAPRMMRAGFAVVRDPASVVTMQDQAVRAGIDPQIAGAVAPLAECEECKGIGGFVEQNDGYQTEQTGVRCEACNGSGIGNSNV